MPRVKTFPSTPVTIVRSHPLPNPTIPTGDVRHSAIVRFGKMDGGIFSKKRLAEIPLDPGVERDIKLGRGKEIVIDAAEKVREGRAQSQARDAKKIRDEGRKADILRDGKKARRKRKSAQGRKSRIQKAQPDKPQKVKREKGRSPQKPKVKKWVKRDK